jgi:molecular chaperone GrpE (heat shock protein)
MTAQKREFDAFFQRAGDQEKNTPRLEVEKLKRSEGEWPALVRILDYVNALHHAGLRSGPPDLINELPLFQNGCRDAARRVGLVAFSPAQNDSFDGRIHQLPDPQAKTEPESPITEVIAPGFRFQTQLLRRALVRVAPADQRTSGSRHGPGAGCRPNRRWDVLASNALEML